MEKRYLLQESPSEDNQKYSNLIHHSNNQRSVGRLHELSLNESRLKKGTKMKAGAGQSKKERDTNSFELLKINQINLETLEERNVS